MRCPFYNEDPAELEGEGRRACKRTGKIDEQLRRMAHQGRLEERLGNESYERYLKQIKEHKKAV